MAMTMERIADLYRRLCPAPIAEVRLYGCGPVGQSADVLMALVRDRNGRSDWLVVSCDGNGFVVLGAGRQRRCQVGDLFSARVPHDDTGAGAVADLVRLTGIAASMWHAEAL